MPTKLPDHYSVHRENQGTLAVLKRYQPALEGLGYSVLEDGERRASDLKGRGNMQEFCLPSGQVLIIRRFRRGGMVRFLSKDRFLDPERPFQEILLSEGLRRRGFHTPVIVAARSRRLGFMGFRLELVTEQVPGAKSLGRWQAQFRSEGVDTPLQRKMLRCTAQTVRRLHDAGFEHSDLQPENLLWQPAADSADAFLWILDLDRSVQHEQALVESTRARNLWRLWRYVLRRESTGGITLTARDYLRFLVAYEPDRAQRKSMIHG
ncbi:MAG: lipopolysaccharide kinase InaA family protein, partial [Planctomycetota bacterium]|nr:lipopolysaccharide kinase InaA family protein [Planctomycetota bacterium]